MHGDESEGQNVELSDGRGGWGLAFWENLEKLKFCPMSTAVLPRIHGGNHENLEGAGGQLCIQGTEQCQDWPHGPFWVSFKVHLLVGFYFPTEQNQR